MALGILVLLTALSISAVAIYYSIAGLVAIFAAAAVPIIVMGTALEIGKLVTAVWLHKYWQKATWWLKTYLTTAVAVLMFITSMGIFGFLSKAHIEQTSMSQEQVALIDTLNEKEARSEAKIARWTDEMNRLMKGEDVRVDGLIDREQQALKELYSQIKLEKDAAREDAEKQIQLQNDRLDQARERKEADIKAAKDRFTGSLGGGSKYDEAVEKAKANELSVASSAQREIRNINNNLNEFLTEIDKKYADDIDAINSRIQKLRSQANNKTEDIDSRIEELENFIDREQNNIDVVREEKLVYEKQYRMLEAEVGPIKYIAEFIYGENADNDMLEEAVRWVIITIIFVFDPLAVLLLIASQYTFAYRKDDNGGRLRQEYEQLRAQKIVDNPGYTVGTPTPEETKEEIDEQPEDTTQEDVESLGTGQEEESPEPEVEDTQPDPEPKEIVEKKDTESLEELEKEIPSNLDNWNQWVEAANKEAEQESVITRTQELTEQEKDPSWNEAKRKWKLENPKQNIKDWKHAYITGRIKEVPWKPLVDSTIDDMKSKNEWPNTSSEYVQNSEQTEESVWQKIQNKNNK